MLEAPGSGDGVLFGGDGAGEDLLAGAGEEGALRGAVGREGADRLPDE